MSETSQQRRVLRVEDVPPLYPPHEIVGDITERSPEDVGMLRDTYTQFLDHDGIVDDSRRRGEIILDLINIELDGRKRDAERIRELEEAFAR